MSEYLRTIDGGGNIYQWVDASDACVAFGHNGQLLSAFQSKEQALKWIKERYDDRDRAPSPAGVMLVCAPTIRPYFVRQQLTEEEGSAG